MAEEPRTIEDVSKLTPEEQQALVDRMGNFQAKQEQPIDMNADFQFIETSAVIELIRQFDEVPYKFGKILTPVLQGGLTQGRKLATPAWNEYQKLIEERDRKSVEDPDGEGGEGDPEE